MSLPKRTILLFLFLVFLLPSKVRAWGGDVHEYLCPQSISGLCAVADSSEFKRNYPLGLTWHLCLDNKPDCPPRLLAKYYVKKYYLEGQKDKNLLGAAAHLVQDSYVPDHWFPMREFGKKIFIPFAPSWVGNTEFEVSRALTAREPGWTVSRRYQGKTVVLNQAYLDDIKTKVVAAISQAPSEDLATLEKQIKDRDFWQKVRGYREWILVGIVILFPFLLFYLWKWKKKGIGKSDLIIVSSIWIVFLILLGLTFAY